MAKQTTDSNKITEDKVSDFNFTKEFLEYKDETKQDFLMRINGVSAKRGSTGKQFAGYTTLEQFYRGDQWDKDEVPGASQKTDNYCAVIVDNLSSLLFDDSPEINCPTSDPTDEIAELKAEIKERALWKVWEDNNYEIEFDAWAKQASLYGDGLMKGPWIQKVDKDGFPVAEDEEGSYKICFQHIENPASVRLIFADSTYTRLVGFIHSDRIPLTKAIRLYGKMAEKKGITIEASQNPTPELGGITDDSKTPQVNIDEYWTHKKMGVFINDKLLSTTDHNWGFVPMEFVKNNYIPNYPYGKSDIEDVLDPQLSHNRTNNDLANLLKWISSINMWGKNIEGMEALVAGLSRIYSLPEDGELHTFEKTGDPYITNTYVQQRRSAIVEISGVSESMLSSGQLANASGRALALAFQGTIRKLNPRGKRFRVALQSMNRNILKLLEIYYPQTKLFIEGNYDNKVYLPTTLLRNIIDTINKFQSGLISQDTAMREAGVAQPNLERKIMKRDLMDPVLGPQVARQPSLLPRLNEGQNQPGEGPMSGPGAGASASQEGAAAAGNSQASGGAPTPTE
jgi:hypothetical protein